MLTGSREGSLAGPVCCVATADRVTMATAQAPIALITTKGHMVSCRARRAPAGAALRRSTLRRR